MSRLKLPSNWPDSWNLKQQGDEYLIYEDENIVARCRKMNKDWNVQSEAYGIFTGMNTLHDVLHELCAVKAVMTRLIQKQAIKPVKQTTEAAPNPIEEVHAKLQASVSAGSSKDLTAIYDELARVNREAQVSHEFAIMSGKNWSEAVALVHKLESQLEDARSAVEYAQAKGFQWPVHALTFMQGNYIEH